MPKISFKKKLSKKEINWLENSGRQKIWNKQKELNSELGENKNNFLNIYICTSSMKKELNTGAKIKEEIGDNLSKNEVFFRLKHNFEENFEKALNKLFEPVPEEFEFKKWFIEKKENYDSSIRDKEDVSEKKVICRVCGVESHEITNWFLVQMYNPKKEKKDDLFWICNECGKQTKINDIEGLGEISKKYNLVDMEKVRCFDCGKKQEINKAGNWWILQIINILENEVGIGNITLFCPNCIKELKLDTFQELKNLLKQIKESQPARNRKINN